MPFFHTETFLILLKILIFFQHPWTALILKGDNFPERIRSLWCGGAIVTRRHMISAAHCFIDQKSHGKEKFTNFDSFLIAVGVQDMVNINPISNRKDIKTIERVDFHPDYLYLDGIKGYNDVAIVTVDSDVTFHELKVWPICVPSHANNPEVRWTDESGQILGYSSDDEDDNHLSGAKMKIYSNRQCNAIFDEELKVVNDCK